MSVPDPRSHWHNVPSQPPEMARRPSGVTATEDDERLVAVKSADLGAGARVPDTDGGIFAARSNATFTVDCQAPHRGRMPRQSAGLAEREGFARRVRVPEPDGPVRSARGQPPVGPERHAADLDRTLAQGQDPPAGRQVPDLHAAAGAGRQQPAVRAERQASAADPFKCADLPPVRRVPQQHCSFLAGGSQASPVGAERHRVDPMAVAAELPDFLSGRGVPEPDHPVVATRGEVSAVGAERHRVDPTAVAAEYPLPVTGVRVPDRDRRILAGGGEAPAVGAERETHDGARVAAEIAGRLPGGGVPEPDRRASSPPVAIRLPSGLSARVWMELSCPPAAKSSRPVTVCQSRTS